MFNYRHCLHPVALSVMALLAPLGVVLAPREGAPMVVLSISTALAAEAIAQAEGVILAPFGRFGLLARSEQAGFTARLYRNGAVLVLGGSDRTGCLRAAVASKGATS